MRTTIRYKPRMRSRGWSAVVVSIAVAIFAAPTARADAGLSIEGHMFMRSSGALDEDLFAQGDASVNNLDYGELASDLVVVVDVPDAVAGNGGTLVVTVKQGKKKLGRRTWRVEGGLVAEGISVAHYPVLVTPTQCGAALVVTATLGTAKATRTLRFTCSE